MPLLAWPCATVDKVNIMNTHTLFLKKQCSRSEQEILRVFRKINAVTIPQLEVAPLLKRLGIPKDKTEEFTNLIEGIVRNLPSMELLGPNSPCVSLDELELLATLNYFSRHPHKATDSRALPVGSALENFPLFKACGQMLHNAGIGFRARPKPQVEIGE
ncbi:hypothetical protein QCD60_25335 [Pokkaliibacter sp. MBI-7]|uniref:hypothetical protein n=1 Tax=Pokkaliibacter sp. MBI-7 TaxID=3040600 RepID=UPI00244C36F8|nr:hypothetical protein [Pokkaliibacter sp. MBI-7]MDH2435857.1 hypothetical protein [Pokkaliibacter sp. MBI-7]